MAVALSPRERVLDAVALGLLLVPLTICIMLSRVILGLHYPSDVLIGVAIGWFVASMAGLFVSL